MINFRFHVVSLVAVFLALTVGIVMGSTVIDRAIVDGLRSQINRVEEKADSQAARNRELTATAERLGQYIDSSRTFIVEGRLADVPAVVFAVDGVATDHTRATVELMQQSGAMVPGILWLTDRWALEDGDARAQLQAILATPSSNVKTLRTEALAALVARLGSSEVQNPALAPVDGAVIGTVPPGATPANDVLGALRDSGFIRYEPVGPQPEEFDVRSYSNSIAGAVVIDGDGAEPAATDALEPLVRALIAADVGVVAGEIYRDGAPAERGSYVQWIRSDRVIRARVSTVDDLDLREGQVSVVLATADLSRGVIGHYGFGRGAARLSPEWSEK